MNWLPGNLNKEKLFLYKNPGKISYLWSFKEEKPMQDLKKKIIREIEENKTKQRG